MIYDVCVIGAGASGMAAAISAARRGKSVILVDKNKKCGSKLYATGNGKCNLKNSYLDSNSYYGKTDIFKMVSSYQDTTYMDDLFNYLNIKTKTNSFGYTYPISEQASSVVWALTDSLKSLGVEILEKTEISRIWGKYGDFSLSDSNESVIIHCKNIIFSVGGLSYANLGVCDKYVIEELYNSLSIQYNTFYPALNSIETVKDFSEIKGVRTKAKVFVMDKSDIYDSEFGEIQFTEYGLTGIAIFNMSKYFNKIGKKPCSYKLYIDFLKQADISLEIGEIITDFLNQVKNNPTRRIVAFLNSYMNDKLAAFLYKDYMVNVLKCENIPSLLKEIDKDIIFNFLSHISKYQVKIKALSDFDKAQVTDGGVECDSIDFSTMELKNKKGVYVTGEAVDIVGKCGGYNLMWAFNSGCLAGRMLD